MTTTTVDNTAAIAPARDGVGMGARAVRRGFFGRVWDGLTAFGEARAKAELARYVRLHGGRSTGDLAQDVRRLAALRGVG